MSKGDMKAISLEEIIAIEESFEYDYCYKRIKSLKVSSYLNSFLLDSLELISKGGYSYEGLVERELEEDWNVINWLQEDSEILNAPIDGDYEGYPLFYVLKRHIRSYLMHYAYLFSSWKE